MNTIENSKQRSALPGKYAAALVITLVLLVFYLTSLYGYLLFHSLAELFAVVIAFGIFVVAWNSRRFLDNHYLLLIGIAYLFVGGLDVVHTLAYRGMGVFPGYEPTNLAAQLWISARYMEALSLLVALLFIRWKLHTGIAFSSYFLITGLLLASIFYWHNFPQTFVVGVGLTPFKVISEYVISFILLASIVLLVRYRGEFGGGMVKLMIAAMAVTIASEMAFTLYVDAYGVANMIGHLLKVLSYYLIYKAVIETGLTKPYDLLFHNLRQREVGLTHQANELAQTNARLLDEIADRQKAEDALRQSEEQLVTYERLAMLGTVAGSIAHELRNPLATIDSSALLLDTELQKLEEPIPGPTASRLVKHLDRIRSSVKHSTTVIQSLLDLTRMKPPQKEELDLRRITDEVLGEVVPGTTQIVRDFPEGGGNVAADKDQLRMAFANIIDNAVQAMGEKGTLSVNIHTDSTHAEISFADTGPGIPADDLRRVFEPLYTTKARGMGLGLAIARMIIDRHGGAIEARSEAGKGATIIVRLPLCRD